MSGEKIDEALPAGFGQPVGTARHTPGPWQWAGYTLLPANPDPDLHQVHTILEVEHFAYGFCNCDLDATSAEDAANRALISAAPQLLDAAKFAAELLARELWNPADTWNPEAVALAKLLAAITAAGEPVTAETVQGN